MIGAEEAHLPTEYREYLETIPRYNPPREKWTKLGAFIFLAFFQPVWHLLDNITHSNTGADGNVPPHIVWLVRGVIFLIWFIHDWIFAPVFGRGDGLGQRRQLDMVGSSNFKEVVIYDEKRNYG
jgi:hypothetical protein